ncbi:hypothetical protein CCACVL1_04078 [Corchorus capsularis]|uniref:PB1-like domain-containing protein n=1 Tax=Corchorus capsularis TaxID=210143 RepID=A0A1R3JV32_COCAP|nr:hypothetical protein CCACVL1_04078 [Corchorus capsularis]
MAFDTATMRFHYEGSFVGEGETFRYEGGYIDDLTFDPDKISWFDLNEICQDAGYRNVHKIRYLRPGFPLHQGMRQITNDYTVLDMVSDMLENANVIDIFIEHFMDDVELIVGLIENGDGGEQNEEQNQEFENEEGFEDVMAEVNEPQVPEVHVANEAGNQGLGADIEGQQGLNDQVNELAKELKLMLERRRLF